MIFLEQLGLDGKRARVKQFLQVDEHSLADTRNGQHFFRVGNQVLDLVRKVLDGLGSVAVGTNAKRILRVDFQQIGGFVENVGDRLIVHESSLNKDGRACHPAWRRDANTTVRMPLRSVTTASNGQRARFLTRYIFFITFAACGPLVPSAISNST